ncbi:MAG: hypothetical protein KDA85_03385, partial [Planctomycetaceae bacterium]|nr:hypothetical protein [Planctomycetaceae bacterium]
MRNLHLAIGLCAWLAAGVAVYQLAAGRSGKAGSSVGDIAFDVGQWTADRRQLLHAASDVPIRLAPGDPVLMTSAAGQTRQVGFVRSTGTGDRVAADVREIDLLIYDQRLNQSESQMQLEYHATPTSLDWVVQTMLPPDRQQEIAGLIADEWAANHEEFMEAIQPVIRESLRIAVAEIRMELPAAANRHREQ